MKPLSGNAAVAAMTKALVIEGLLDEPKFDQGDDPGGIESRRIYNADVAEAVITALNVQGFVLAFQPVRTADIYARPDEADR